jgi:hypothetical protein
MTMTTATATATERIPAPAARPPKTEIRPPKALPAPNSDFYQLADVLTPDEMAVVKKVRTYMESKVQPLINKYWSDDAFPFELLPSFKELGLGGLGYQGYGCAGGSQTLFGFVGFSASEFKACAPAVPSRRQRSAPPRVRGMHRSSASESSQDSNERKHHECRANRDARADCVHPHADQVGDV